jgi:proteasome lid subunit RPN8/RPN11
LVIGDFVICHVGVLDAIADHARRAAPLECCGLLIGSEKRIDEAEPVENRSADPLCRYEVDPRDFLASVKRCRGTSMSVIGVYHSHPHSSAEPSDSDRAEAFGPFLYLIAGPVAGELPPPIRAYRWENGNFRSIRLVPDGQELQT